MASELPISQHGALEQHAMGKNSALTSHRRGARQPASCIPGAFCSNSTQPLARHFPPPG